MKIQNYHNNIELDSSKFIALVLSVFLFFILPITVIQENTPKSSQPINGTGSQESGQVAGVSIENKVEETSVIELEKIGADSVFLTIGIILIGVSAILIIFLILEGRKRNHDS